MPPRRLPYECTSRAEFLYENSAHDIAKSLRRLTAIRVPTHGSGGWHRLYRSGAYVFPSVYMKIVLNNVMGTLYFTSARCLDPHLVTLLNTLFASDMGTRLSGSVADYQRTVKDIEHHRHHLDVISELATMMALAHHDVDALNLKSSLHDQVEASKAVAERCLETMSRYEKALGEKREQNVFMRIYWSVHWHLSNSATAAAEARRRMSEDRTNLAIDVARFSSYVLFLLLRAGFRRSGLSLGRLCNGSSHGRWTSTVRRQTHF